MGCRLCPAIPENDENQTKVPCLFSCLCGLTLLGLLFTASYLRFVQDEPTNRLVLGVIWCVFLGCMAAWALMLVRAPHFRQFKPGREFIWACVDFDELATATPQYYIVRLEPGSKTCRERRAHPPETKPWPQKTCLCCLEDFQSQGTLSILPCGHVFHENCIVDWFSASQTRGTCPVCRYSARV